MSDVTNPQLDGNDVQIVTVNLQQTHQAYQVGYIPDDDWTHVDNAGHIHRWFGDHTPTLVPMFDGLECVWCAEQINPGYRHCTDVETMVGLYVFRAELETDRPYTIDDEVLFTCDEYAVPSIVTLAVSPGDIHLVEIVRNGPLLMRERRG